MQTLIVPASRGWRWFSDGFALLRANPPALALLVIVYWLLIAIINIVPFIGPVLASMCIPVFSVGIMNACRELDRGDRADSKRFIGISYLFSAFRPTPAPLFALGALYLALTLLALGIASLLDDGALMQWALGNIEAREALENSGLLAAAQFCMLLMTPVIMAYWFAPILVAWHAFSPAKALFFSFFACLRNWRPFLAYTASLVVWCVFLPGLILLIADPLLQDNRLRIAIAVAIALFLTTTLFASFYVSYREVFAEPDRVDVRA